MNITIDIIKSGQMDCHYLGCDKKAAVVFQASFTNGGWIPPVWYCMEHLAQCIMLHMEHDNTECQWDGDGAFQRCIARAVGILSIDGLYHGPMCVDHSIVTIELLRPWPKEYSTE